MVFLTSVLNSEFVILEGLSEFIVGDRERSGKLIPLFETFFSTQSLCLTTSYVLNTIVQHIYLALPVC